MIFLIIIIIKFIHRYKEYKNCTVNYLNILMKNNICKVIENLELSNIQSSLENLKYYKCNKYYIEYMKRKTYV